MPPAAVLSISDKHRPDAWWPCTAYDRLFSRIVERRRPRWICAIMVVGATIMGRQICKPLHDTIPFAPVHLQLLRQWKLLAQPGRRSWLNSDTHYFICSGLARMRAVGWCSAMISRRNNGIAKINFSCSISLDWHCWRGGSAILDGMASWASSHLEPAQSAVD